MGGASKIKNLVGLIPSLIQEDDESITFEFEGGGTAHFYHSQDCCENVHVDDVNGNWADLIGVPLLVVDERVSDESECGTPEGCTPRDAHNTWTFYTFRSVRGSVDVRWHGSSSGYYSERVSLFFKPGN